MSGRAGRPNAPNEISSRQQHHLQSRARESALEAFGKRICLLYDWISRHERRKSRNSAENRLSEVDYEGAASFLKDDLIDLMERVVGFFGEHKAAIPADPPTGNAGGRNGGGSAGKLDHLRTRASRS